MLCSLQDKVIDHAGKLVLSVVVATSVLGLSMCAGALAGSRTAEQIGPLDEGDRIVRVVDAASMPGGEVTVPIQLVASGTENALSFSLTYDSDLLSGPQVAKGTDATSASLVVNTTQTARVGAVLWLPFGQSFPAGDREILRITFRIANDASPQTTPLTFTDTPAARDISDNSANSLPATWVNGTVTVLEQFTLAVNTPYGTAVPGTVTNAAYGTTIQQRISPTMVPSTNAGERFRLIGPEVIGADYTTD